MNRRFLFTLAVLVFLTNHTAAQTPRIDKVRIETRDGVTLRGDFYPGKGRSMPCVLLLHDLGTEEDRQTWKPLAGTLQKRGYAVLAFDFRGHGDSTEVDDAEFWQGRYSNRNFVRAASKSEIAFKQFDRRYYPALANDIAAAKAFLDRKNDAGDCNSSNLVVIGAGQGATLGALWINAEWHRHQLIPPTFVGQPPRVHNSAEGENILGAVFLDISPTLGGRQVNLHALLDTAARQKKMPTVFLYGADDTEGKRLAHSLEKSIKQNRDLAFTGAVAVPGASSSEASALVEPGLGTGKAIIDYLETLRDEEGDDWMELDFEKTLYVWKARNGNLTQANSQGDRNLFFLTYDAFLPGR